jgi:hypothetical protein
MLLGMPQSWACLLLARPNILELWPGWYAQDGTWGVLLAGAKENAWGPTSVPPIPLDPYDNHLTLHRR